MHHHGLVHMDVKPDNMFAVGNLEVKDGGRWNLETLDSQLELWNKGLFPFFTIFNFFVQFFQTNLFTL